jgi:uncharacterized protein YceK
MKQALTAAALALSALSGCGTVYNLQGGGTPYGGVSEAAQAGADAWRYWHHPEGACIPPSFDLARAVYLFGIDLPLSAVGDTLTLPVTIWWWLSGRRSCPRPGGVESSSTTGNSGFHGGEGGTVHDLNTAAGPG